MGKLIINKLYLHWIIDQFEADMYETTIEGFDKRCSVTRRGGRPYLYTPREIGEQMVKHFRRCIEYNQPFTISGLCWELGISRQGMLNMKKSSKYELVDIIKKSRAIVEVYLESQLHLKQNPSGAIFVLKNMGWRC